MRTIILSSVAALAIAGTAPAIAQDSHDHSDAMSQSGTATAEGYAMSSAQRTMYDGWPADRRSTYDAWPREAQEYYWTLDDSQTQAWWILNDEQRVRIVGMTPEQRAQTWTSIAAQMSGTAPAAAAPQGSGTMQGQGSAAGQMQFVRSEVVQTTPGDQGAATGEMPICSAGQQDNCMNAWEAGKRGRGVTKPLDHWPGRPASEMSGDTTPPES